MTQVSETAPDLLAALDRGESIPARWYTDPSITEQEITHIFRKSWNYVIDLSASGIEPDEFVHPVLS